MVRVLTAGMLAELDAPVFRPVRLFEALFNTPLRLWTGIGDLLWDGKTFTGSGSLLDISPAEETQNVKATNATFQLNFFDPALLALIANNQVHGVEVTVWEAFLDEAGAVIADPFLLFQGELDVPQTKDSGDSGQIVVNGENALAELFRNQGRRYTAEDQAIEHEGDSFFDFVTDQSRQIVWRR